MWKVGVYGMGSGSTEKKMERLCISRQSGQQGKANGIWCQIVNRKKKGIQCRNLIDLVYSFYVMFLSQGLGFLGFLQTRVFPML
jgi:hypothetical protein